MTKFIIDNIPTIATIGFAVGFCYIIFSTFRKENKKKFKDYSKIPLEDQD